MADPEVQDRRKRKHVHVGLLLHDYANLYVTARNPMLFKRIKDSFLDELCVIRVSPAVLDQEGVVISDRNAATFGCRFKAAVEGLEDVDDELQRIGPDWMRSWRSWSNWKSSPIGL